MIPEQIKEKRITELFNPVKTKAQLFKKFSYVDEHLIRLTINECISENRNKDLKVVKWCSKIYPKEYEMFIERMEGLI